MSMSQRASFVALLCCLPLWGVGCDRSAGDGGPEPTEESRWCLAEDMALLDRDDATAVMVGCAADCAGESNVDTCARACFLEQVPVRSECSECFVSLAKCLDEKCSNDCESGVDSSECQACSAENCDFSMDTCLVGRPTEPVGDGSAAGDDPVEEGSAASDAPVEEGSAGEPFIADGSALGAEVPEGSGSDAPFVPDGSGLAPEIL